MAFPTSGCVAYYKLNEAAGTTRMDSVGSNNLADHNTVGSSAGKISNAADFVSASGQYLTCPDAAAFQMGTGDFSFAIWVKSSTGSTQNALCYGNPEAVSGGYGLRWNSTGLEAVIGDNSSHLKSTPSIHAWNDGNWHLAIVTADRSGNLTLYVDNALESAIDITTVTGSVNSVIQGFFLGTYAAGFRQYDGSDDEVGLWNRVLTGTDQTTLWNGGAGLTYPVSTQSQRRTLSALGTRIGSRQLQEV